MRYPCTLTRMAVIKRTGNNKSCGARREIALLVRCWRDCGNRAAALENRLAVPRKVKTWSYHLTQPFPSSAYTQEIENRSSYKILFRDCHGSINHSNQKVR